MNTLTIQQQIHPPLNHIILPRIRPLHPTMNKRVPTPGSRPRPKQSRIRPLHIHIRRTFILQESRVGIHAQLYVREIDK